MRGIYLTYLFIFLICILFHQKIFHKKPHRRSSITLKRKKELLLHSRYVRIFFLNPIVYYDRKALSVL